MKNLFVDLDGTISNQWERIIRNSKNGKILDSCWSYEEHMKDGEIPFVRWALQEFIRAEWNVYILTARPYKEAFEATMDWLENKKIPFSGVFIVKQAENKLKVLLDQKANLFIDDFIAGYEHNKPIFVIKVYQEILQSGIDVEPFRNNWEEIVKRRLG